MMCPPWRPLDTPLCLNRARETRSTSARCSSWTWRRSRVQKRTTPANRQRVPYSRLVSGPRCLAIIWIPKRLLIGCPETFEFRLVLPSNLPPSHEVPFGHTRYKLEAHYNGHTVVHHFCVGQWVGLKKRNNNIVSLTTSEWKPIIIIIDSSIHRSCVFNLCLFISNAVYYQITNIVFTY